MAHNYWLYALLRKAYHFCMLPASFMRKSTHISEVGKCRSFAPSYNLGFCQLAPSQDFAPANVNKPACSNSGFVQKVLYHFVKGAKAWLSEKHKRLPPTRVPKSLHPHYTPVSQALSKQGRGGDVDRCAFCGAAWKPSLFTLHCLLFTVA
jgi:hypothetical protein